MTRNLVGVIHPGEVIADELAERGWTTADLAARMPGDPAINAWCVELYMHVHDSKLMLDRETAEGLALAFGTSVEFWERLDAAWRAGTEGK